MKAQFRILSGSRAGQTDVFSKLEIVVGRHPSCDLKLHPEQDLDVSSRHAVITKIGNTWTLRDLQSRNGVFLNGHKIEKDTRIDDTDLIQLGSGGPRLEFRTVADSVADTPAPVFSSTTDGPPRITSGAAIPRPAHANPPITGPRARASTGPSTTQRIRVEVARQTKKLKRVSVALVAVLIVAVGGFFAFTQQQENAREREVVAMRAQMDSLQHSAQSSVEALRGQVAGLADALRASQSQVQGLQAQLATAQASGDRQQIAQLRRQLDDASQAVRNQQMAAQVDFNAIYRANQRAVGMIYVRFENGSVFTGTAFAVRPDGIMLTNKHVVRGKDGTQTPREIAMQFADSKQVWQTQVLAVSDEVDLAVVRVTVGGPVPPVKGLAGTAAQPGDPVAVIGFPLGLDLPMQSAGEGRPIVKTSLNAGTVSKVLPDRIQFDGYGAEGASGSPIFDRSGDVMAVLFGGEPGTNGRVVYGVPVSYVTRLLQQIN